MSGQDLEEALKAEMSAIKRITNIVAKTPAEARERVLKYVLQRVTSGKIVGENDDPTGGVLGSG